MNEESTPTQRAVDYARATLRVFPIHFDPNSDTHKRPLPGYPWRQRATNDINEVVQDFTEAEMLWGIDNVGVAWASGEDGYVVIDVDRKEIPAWTQAFDFATGRQETGQGWHFIAKFPPDFEPGNHTANLPDHNGVDVRGKGGYIIIDAADRPGLQIAELRKCQPFPKPEWLVPYAGQVDHATKAEVKAFAVEHTQMRQPGSLDGIRRMLDNFNERQREGATESRHNMAVGMATQVAIEARRGYYPFTDGLRVVQDWWKAQLAADPKRPVQRHEWGSIVSWAVGRALLESPPTDSTVETEPHVLTDDGITLVDWHEFFTKERLDPEWLVQDLWPFGRHISIGSRAGRGKSELIQYIVSCLALGIDPWTRREQPPMKVIYLDMEMTEEDLFSRMTDFGYGVDQAPALQSHLLYAVLPVIPALNSAAGLRFIEGLVDRHSPDVFIIDTFMKTLQGDENDAATVQEFVRLSGMLLKARRVASGRTDHYGKSAEQGNRGTSAKDDDVDVAWHLERVGRYGTKLTATKRRQGFVPETLFYERYHTADDGVRFAPRDQIIDNIPSEGARALVAALDICEVPLSWGRDRVRQRLLEGGYTATNAELSEALKLRKERGPLLTVVTDSSSDRYTGTEDVDK